MQKTFFHSPKEEHFMNRKIQSLLALLVIASVVLAACGGAAPAATEAPVEATEAAAEEPAVEPTVDPYSPLEVSGDVVTAGSSTVFPLSERMAERFRNEGFVGNITVDSIGSGAGIERFCVEGESDVINSSRAIRDTEIESCGTIGLTPVEFRVGTDALAVVVSAENDFVTDLTLAEVALIFSTATNWSDVRPEWPNEPILRFSPGTDSGTFDYFVEAIYDTDETPILSSAGTQFSEDDNVLVQGVLGSPYAVGYFGYAYYNENADVLHIASIEGVSPTAETVEDGSYALARPLFMYSDASILQSKPQVAAFIHFYLTYVNEEIVDVGYFPASEAALQTAWDNFWAAVGQ
jgi:phosphate transport system substrate-binding protein